MVRGRVLLVVAFVLTGAALVWAWGGALAQEPPPLLPTPTLPPVAEAPYTLSAVGGAPYTFTVEHGDPLGSSVVTSRYPQGLEFALQPFADAAAWQDVSLRLTFVGGAQMRVAATWDAARGAWVALLDPAQRRLPAWAHMEARWRVRTGDGALLESAPFAADYADVTRRWWRCETDEMVVYWFGFSQDAPEAFAQKMAWALAATRNRRVQGFGGTLSYRAVGVIYDSWDTMREMEGGGPVNRGGAFYDLGMSVLGSVGGDDVEWLRDRMAFLTVHELVHLYQFEKLGGTLGPTWWVEGQAQWFGTHPGEYDARLRHLLTLQPLPTLTHEITRDIVQADGLPDLAYDMGASFINWLLAHYGGLPTHAAIVQRMHNGDDLYTAVEGVTGETFFALENAWRVYLGAPPLAQTDVDPAAALEEAPDALFAVGESVTLPAAPALVSLMEMPGPKALASGQCFGGMEVTVLRVGALAGTTYVQVDCMGQVGWLQEAQLGGE